MKLRYLTYIILCIVVSLLAINPSEAYAAKKKTKAKTTQTSSNKKKSGSKKSTKTSSGSKSTKSKSSKKGKSGKKRGRNVVKSTYKAEPKEMPQNDSLTLAVNSALLAKIPSHMNPGGLRVNSVKLEKGDIACNQYVWHLIARQYENLY